jgi:hypothetical protein
LLSLSVHVQESSHIESRLLGDLHLSDEYVLEGVDSLASLLNGEGDGFGESGKLLHKLSKSAVGDFLGHGINHSLSDLSDLTHLGVRSLSNLAFLLSGESNAEHSEFITIGGSDGSVAFNESLPLVDERAKLVSGHIHTVEVGEALISSHIFHNKLDLSVALLLVSVKVGKVDIEDSALKLLRSHSGAESSVDQGSTAHSVREKCRSLDVVPVLSGEGVDNFLLAALFSLVKSGVLTNSHSILIHTKNEARNKAKANREFCIAPHQSGFASLFRLINSAIHIHVCRYANIRVYFRKNRADKRR